jgi:hypothetical protein
MIPRFFEILEAAISGDTSPPASGRPT